MVNRFNVKVGRVHHLEISGYYLEIGLYVSLMNDHSYKNIIYVTGQMLDQLSLVNFMEHTDEMLVTIILSHDVDSRLSSRLREQL